MISSFQLVLSFPVRWTAQQPTEALGIVPASAAVSWFAASVNGSSLCTHWPWLVSAQSCHWGWSLAPAIWQQLQGFDPAKKDEKKKINLIREVTTEALILSADALTSVFSCPKAKTPHGLTWPCVLQWGQWGGGALISKDQHKKKGEKLKVNPKLLMSRPRPWGPIRYHSCSHRAAWLAEGVWVKHDISHDFSNCYTERQKESCIRVGFGKWM